MKKFLTLLLLILAAGILNPASAQNTSYKIKQDGSSMVIVPYYYTAPVQKPLLYTPPAKIPFYENKKLPKGINKNRMA